MINLTQSPDSAAQLTDGDRCLVDGREFVVRFTAFETPMIFLTETNSPGLSTDAYDEEEYTQNFRHVRDAKGDPASRLGPACMTVERLIEVLKTKTYRIK